MVVAPKDDTRRVPKDVHNQLGRHFKGSIRPFRGSKEKAPILSFLRIKT
jgi:hypothetical protein